MTSTDRGAVVAIIPARGGSKGVPRKNVLPVGGVPLVARAVRAAVASARVDAVYVTTDDAEIARVAEAAGAAVIARPAELAGDTASSESAILHALDEIERLGVQPQTVVFLQATSPFIASEAIDRAVDRVAGGEFDSVFSAFETYGFLWGRDADGRARALNHDASHRPRRQDREPHFLETGAFYAFRADGFRAAGHRFFGRIGIVEVPESSAIEIDDLEQFRLAGAIAPVIEPAEAIDVDALVTDFDGVHTDDTAIIDAHGGEQVRVSRADGMGVSRLRAADVPVLILSTEVHAVVRARAEKLRVEVAHGVDDKASELRRWAAARGLDLARVAYVGNDVNDIEAMRLVGWPIAVSDAKPEVQRIARVVLSRAGGQGAVREVADRILRARQEASNPVG